MPAETDLSQVPTIIFVAAWFENELAGEVLAVTEANLKLAGRRFAYEIVLTNDEVSVWIIDQGDPPLFLLSADDDRRSGGR